MVQSTYMTNRYDVDDHMSIDTYNNLTGIGPHDVFTIDLMSYIVILDYVGDQVLPNEHHDLNAGGTRA